MEGTKAAGERFGAGAGGDFTTKMDKLSEQIIVRRLKESGEPHILVSEELGTYRQGYNPQAHVVVDSIDGTTNAVRGIPFYCTSIAVSSGERMGSVDLGLVMDLHNGEMFHAIKGAGAFLNSKNIRVPSPENLTDAVIVVNLSKANEELIRRTTPLISNFRYFRNLGAVALEMSYVACGRLDGVVDLKNTLRATDVAAAQLILKEAGGFMVDGAGKEVDILLEPTARVSIVAAGNHDLLQSILKVLV